MYQLPFAPQALPCGGRQIAACGVAGFSRGRQGFEPCRKRVARKHATSRASSPALGAVVRPAIRVATATLAVAPIAIAFAPGSPGSWIVGGKRIATCGAPGFSRGRQGFMPCRKRLARKRATSRASSPARGAVARPAIGVATATLAVAPIATAIAPGSPGSWIVEKANCNLWSPRLQPGEAGLPALPKRRAH
jgi:hypothetical protein